MGEFAGDRRRVAHTIARALQGFAHGLQVPPGDGGNLPKGEALDTIEKKSFAVGATRTAQRSLQTKVNRVRDLGEEFQKT